MSWCWIDALVRALAVLGIAGDLAKSWVLRSAGLSSRIADQAGVLPTVGQPIAPGRLHARWNTAYGIAGRAPTINRPIR